MREPAVLSCTSLPVVATLVLPAYQFRAVTMGCFCPPLGRAEASLLPFHILAGVISVLPFLLILPSLPATLLPVSALRMGPLFSAALT